MKPSHSPHTAIFVDTAGWADPILRNTESHQLMTVNADDLLSRHSPIVTTNYVINELVALLTNRAHSLPRADLLNYVNKIVAMSWLRYVHVDEELHAEAWGLLQRVPDKDWSLVDAASFVVMRRLGLTEAFTSDHHFLQAGFARVPYDQ